MSATITRRLAALEATMAADLADPPGPPFLVLHIEDWDPADRAAYDAAAGPGAEALRAQLVTAYTGETPGPGTILVELHLVPGGPE